MNDGSSIVGLQVVVTESADGWQNFLEGKISTGAAVTARGQLVKSPGGKQSVSFMSRVLSWCDSWDFLIH